MLCRRGTPEPLRSMFVRALAGGYPDDALPVFRTKWTVERHLSWWRRSPPPAGSHGATSDERVLDHHSEKLCTPQFLSLVDYGAICIVELPLAIN